MRDPGEIRAKLAELAQRRDAASTRRGAVPILQAQIDALSWALEPPTSRRATLADAEAAAASTHRAGLQHVGIDP